jgi:hypothetical protein
MQNKLKGAFSDNAPKKDRTDSAQEIRVPQEVLSPLEAFAIQLDARRRYRLKY